jgi:SAM-dependent methyltransferase
LAREKVPAAELRRAGAERLPFGNDTFEYVTCIEVLEHLPPELRPLAFQEMRRVLQPGGKLILTVPHAGSFAWLDSNNLRLRAPGLYTRLLGGGRRDANYKALSRNVEWHYHFNEHELLTLAGEGWEMVAVVRGGLFLYPLMDWLSWPFYRFGIPHHPLRRTFERIAGWDYRIDFGKASYGILVVLRRNDSQEPTSVASGDFAVCP